MVQELRFLLNSTQRLVEEIASRMNRGDAATDLVNQLVSQTKIVGRYVARLDDEVARDFHQDLRRLLSAVNRAVSIGDHWLSEASGSELAAQNLQRRISQAYGLVVHYN